MSLWQLFATSFLLEIYIEKRNYIELYQHPAARLFKFVFAWLLITMVNNLY